MTELDKDAELLAQELEAPPQEPAEEASPTPQDEHEAEEHDEVHGRVDEELDAASTDEAREAIRERRRQEKRDRNARRRERDASQQRRLDELTAQNAAMQAQLASINGSLASSQLNQHRTHLQQAKVAVQQYTSAYADAVTAGDGPAAAAALQNMQKAQRAELYFEQAVHAAQTPPPRAAHPGGAPTPQLNPAMVSKATAFMAKHAWYKGHESAEPDSAVLTALDAALAKEGWDPATDEYWTELDARAARYLPGRFGKTPSDKAGYNSNQGPRPQATSGAGGHSAGGKSNGEFSLSAQRVAAMKEAGQWDDPVKRKAMIEQYRAYDTNNRK
jgi:hypothetical protein